MKNKIAFFAMLAIALFSITATAQTTGTTTKYAPSGRFNTDPDHVIYVGIIDGQFIDHDMVPVRMCSGGGEVVWAEFAMYTTAVEANQCVAKGDTVRVQMKQRHRWYWFNEYFEITSISIQPKIVPVPTVVPTVTPVPGWFKKPDVKHVAPPRVRKVTPRITPTPCPQTNCGCGNTTITIINGCDPSVKKSDGTSGQDRETQPVERTWPQPELLQPSKKIGGPESFVKVPEEIVAKKKTSKLGPSVFPWSR